MSFLDIPGTLLFRGHVNGLNGFDPEGFDDGFVVHALGVEKLNS